MHLSILACTRAHLIVPCMPNGTRQGGCTLVCAMHCVRHAQCWICARHSRQRYFHTSRWGLLTNCMHRDCLCWLHFQEVNAKVGICRSGTCMIMEAIHHVRSWVMDCDSHLHPHHCCAMLLIASDTVLRSEHKPVRFRGDRRCGVSDRLDIVTRAVLSPWLLTVNWHLVPSLLPFFQRAAT